MAVDNASSDDVNDAFTGVESERDAFGGSFGRQGHAAPRLCCGANSSSPDRVPASLTVSVAPLITS